MERSTLIPLTDSRTIPHLHFSLPGYFVRNPKSHGNGPRPGSPPLRSPIDWNLIPTERYFSC
jgi:hypothetical protein